MLPAGTYYIGDLFYVMHPDWDEFCEKFLESDGQLCTLADGRKFWFNFTAYGDGIYHDTQGNSYGVDAGLIGIIAVDSISPSELPSAATAGHVKEFKKPFLVSYDDGVFQIGDIRIDTKGYDEWSDGIDDPIDDNWESSYDYITMIRQIAIIS